MPGGLRQATCQVLRRLPSLACVASAGERQIALPKRNMFKALPACLAALLAVFLLDSGVRSAVASAVSDAASYGASHATELLWTVAVASMSYLWLWFRAVSRCLGF